MKYILAVCLLLLPFAASAQQSNCGDRGAMVETLANRYGESRQSIGIASGPQIVETFANLETGTWTILITRATGLTCMVAAGEGFERLDEELKTGVRI